jgi:AraC family transcriptional regulator
MIIYIKNMVCIRCKMAVQSVLEALQIDYKSIELGRVKLRDYLSSEQKKALNTALQKYELELMEDKKKILVEQVKSLILEIFHQPDTDMELKLSAYLSKKLNYEYTYLSNMFSEMEGSTIERFYIVSRVERVKELMVYEDLTLSEIAYQLKFSSVSHLCQQFKKVTGETPSDFKRLCESDGYIWRKV